MASPIDLNWVDAVLKGIDSQDHQPYGWWDNSADAAFGAAKLAELKAEIERRYHS